MGKFVALSYSNYYTDTQIITTNWPIAFFRILTATCLLQPNLTVKLSEESRKGL
jgi:hypothetical protein